MQVAQAATKDDVTIHVVQVGGRTPEPLPEVITPGKYGSRETSDLRCTIKPGGNRLDFDLKSK